MYKGIDVANYIIGYTNSLNNPVTNLKLQQILYFIQGYSYRILDKAFILDDFEAWPYGPVVRDICIEFSRFGSLLITDFYNSNYENIYFEDRDKNFLDQIIKELNKFSVYKLVSASHAKNSPWDIKYEKDKPNIINKDDIEKFFKELDNEQK